MAKLSILAALAASAYGSIVSRKLVADQLSMLEKFLADETSPALERVGAYDFSKDGSFAATFGDDKFFHMKGFVMMDPKVIKKKAAKIAAKVVEKAQAEGCTAMAFDGDAYSEQGYVVIIVEIKKLWPDLKIVGFCGEFAWCSVASRVETWSPDSEYKDMPGVGAPSIDTDITWVTLPKMNDEKPGKKMKAALAPHAFLV